MAKDLGYSYAMLQQEEKDRAEYWAMVRETVLGLLAVVLGFLWAGWAVVRILQAIA